MSTADRAGRADYALPRGARALESVPAVRVLRFVVPLVLCAMLACGYWLGRSADAEVAAPAALDLTAGQRLAAGPLADLLHEGPRFVGLVGQHPSEPVLWRGIERLARAALADVAAVDAEAVAGLEDVIRAFAPPEATHLGPLLASHRGHQHRRAGE
jgi:hypothetical protein